MPLFALDTELRFPPVHLAEPDGLLAMGGDLSPQRLLLAYRSGIFPWYEGEPVLWWSPDPRFVLFPEELKRSRTIRSLEKKNDPSGGGFRFTTNTMFEQVIHYCKTTRRPGQEGTWITPEVEAAYTELHRLGYAHSAELWQGDELVGGLYGIRLGLVFFGESMFSKVSNASRFAFSQYVHLLQQEGVRLIDCQIYTEYLESMGARMISREKFVSLLDSYC